MREECGIVGIFGSDTAAVDAMKCQHNLNHRGQESSGVASATENQLYCQKGMGLVLEVLGPKIHLLPGNMAIGHNRYSTAGGSTILNAQPFTAKVKYGEIAVAHNGTITNAAILRTELEKTGGVLQSSSDTEVVLHLIARSTQPDLTSAITEALGSLEGAFSLVFLTTDSIIAARDPNGFRPLAIGHFGKGYIFASETSAFKSVHATYDREVQPGEIVIISKDGLSSFQYTPPTTLSQCVFEHIYFARPDSLVFGRGVAMTREELGKKLSQISPVEGDIVVGVPDSGTPAAIGYAEACNIRYKQGLIRDHYTGRSFIQPSVDLRESTIERKLSPVTHLLAGKRVILVDDSIVRGITSQKIVAMVRGAGATEVHLRISSPPLKNPCFYGVDIPTREELVANCRSVEEICSFVGADTLAYLPIEDLLLGVGKGHCLACLDGNYPTLVQIST